MDKRVSCVSLALAVLLVAVISSPAPLSMSRPVSNPNLTSQETQVAALVNGTRVYSFDLELEEIGLRSDLSNYSFRSGGSAGATATALLLRDKFEGFGLEVGLEPFEFTTWNLMSKPTMMIDADGNSGTISDQAPLVSFQSEHLSWPTPQDGILGELVVLPLPAALERSEVGASPIDVSAWNAVNTIGKIVLIGREVRWATDWLNVFMSKLSSQPPVAVVFTWWYDWMSFSPASYSSIGGHAYWSFQVPVGSLNYQDGLLLRNHASTGAVWVKVKIDAVISSGPHYNVVGKIVGAKDPSNLVIVSGHYDTVVTAGFCDNGAGTAGVLELAKVFSQANQSGVYRPDYTLVFVAFDSEEFWLVGSVNYVSQHKSAMANTIAVVNLDCIGSDNLAVTETEPDGLFDLDATVLQSARDLGVAAATDSPGGSDQETFRNPNATDDTYSQAWGVEAGISDITPVKSSVMVISHPLFPADIATQGKSGWIHTSYDNSTSIEASNWVDPTKLEEQVKVVALSVMRVSSSSSGVDDAWTFPWLVFGLGIIVAGVVVAVMIVCIVRFRKSGRKDAVLRTVLGYIVNKNTHRPSWRPMAYFSFRNRG